MENQKITFEKELTFNGVTYQREAVYGLPEPGDYFLDNEGRLNVAKYYYENCTYIILTPKKEVYTVIKFKGKFDQTWAAIKHVYNIPIAEIQHETVEE